MTRRHTVLIKKYVFTMLISLNDFLLNGFTVKSPSYFWGKKAVIKTPTNFDVYKPHQWPPL